MACSKIGVCWSSDYPRHGCFGRLCRGDQRRLCWVDQSSSVIRFERNRFTGEWLSLRPEALVTERPQNWFVRSASEVEQNVVSVERIFHYAKDLEPEAPYEIPENKPTSGWPTAGEVEFR
jgi:hypothetical protein